MMFRAIRTYFTELLATLTRLETVMGQVSDALAGVQVQLGKARQEISHRISDLENQLAVAGKLDDADQAAINAIKDAALDLDNIVPDAPVEPAPAEPVATPVEEPAAPVDEPDQGM
ncbi:hypothetical protein [Nocardia wallacei]|uniref:hypothetical protein n=1 Tax=Nocardia wallacei TaxID=480035 RepID=UPI002458F599|nr:hypothetical protein [Nocardia wallacei]